MQMKEDHSRKRRAWLDTAGCNRALFLYLTNFLQTSSQSLIGCMTLSKSLKVCELPFTLLLANKFYILRKLWRLTEIKYIKCLHMWLLIRTLSNIFWLHISGIGFHAEKIKYSEVGQDDGRYKQEGKRQWWSRISMEVRVDMSNFKNTNIII